MEKAYRQTLQTVQNSTKKAVGKKGKKKTSESGVLS